MFCIASGVISSFLVYRATKPPSQIQSVSVAFYKSISQCSNHEINPVQLEQKTPLIPMHVARSQVEQCIDTYCVLCRHPIFIDAMLCMGLNWMEVRIDNALVVQMCVELPSKEININNKNG